MSKFKLTGHGNIFSKAKDKAEDLAKDVAKGALESVAKPFEATYHFAQAGGYALQGEWDKAQHKLAQGVGDVAYMTAGLTADVLVPGMSIVTGGILPSVAKKAEYVAEASANYLTGNWKRGTENLEMATGHDIDNSEARARNQAAAEAAQKAAEDEVKKANQLAENERRAKLFSLRKQVGIRNVGVASIWGSGSASSSTKDEQTGIILG